MRTALIIGSPDSIHTVNFIDSVLINGNKVDRIDLHYFFRYEIWI